MNSGVVLKIMHLSDLHFIATADGRPDKNGHSVDCLREISSIFEAHQPDCLVVTGDITDRGDNASLSLAYQWIHDQIYINGEYLGLQAKTKGVKVIIVPGNHDAYNSNRWGRFQNRWQKSLSNYHSVFKEYGFEDQISNVDYVWLSKNNLNVFVSRIDSCYMGDKVTNSISAPFAKIAKGKISLSQSEKVMSLYDQALNGQLKNSNGEAIDAGDFQHSLKMVVMHHYLFQPAEHKVEKLLETYQSNDVFQNFAMADFDILLCGHKHIGDVYGSTYSNHFDPRGKLRLGLNYLRRVYGIAALPLRTDGTGRLIPKPLRIALAFITLRVAGKETTLSEGNVKEILAILDRSIEHPEILLNELRNFLEARPYIQKSGVVNEQEISNLYAKMKKYFPPERLRQLKLSTKPLKHLFEKTYHRPFIQIMAASSAKLAESNSRSRAVNIYEIASEGDKYSFLIKKFQWNKDAPGSSGSIGNFSPPFGLKYFFEHSRIVLNQSHAKT